MVTDSDVLPVREMVFRKWFTRESLRQVYKPLTVRMFAESAKAGRWLYD